MISFLQHGGKFKEHLSVYFYIPWCVRCKIPPIPFCWDDSVRASQPGLAVPPGMDRAIHKANTPSVVYLGYSHGDETTQCHQKESKVVKICLSCFKSINNFKELFFQMNLYKIPVSHKSQVCAQVHSSRFLQISW